jgi:hypothetical protein
MSPRRRRPYRHPRYRPSTPTLPRWAWGVLLLLGTAVPLTVTGYVLFVLYATIAGAMPR